MSNHISSPHTTLAHRTARRMVMRSRAWGRAAMGKGEVA
jgi:hypothetical protein